MTARQRVLTARLAEKLKRQPEYRKLLGLTVEFTDAREHNKTSK